MSDNSSLCSKCGKEVYQVVRAYVSVPIMKLSLSEEDFASGQAVIETVDWDDCVWRCGCTVKRPRSFAAEAARVAERRKTGKRTSVIQPGDYRSNTHGLCKSDHPSCKSSDED